MTPYLLRGAPYHNCIPLRCRYTIPKSNNMYNMIAPRLAGTVYKQGFDSVGLGRDCFCWLGESTRCVTDTPGLENKSIHLWNCLQTRYLEGRVYTAMAAVAERRPLGPMARKKEDKIIPPSPPRVLYDKTKEQSFQRLDFLGEVRPSQRRYIDAWCSMLTPDAGRFCPCLRSH